MRIYSEETRRSFVAVHDEQIPDGVGYLISESDGQWSLPRSSELLFQDPDGYVSTEFQEDQRIYDFYKTRSSTDRPVVESPYHIVSLRGLRCVLTYHDQQTKFALDFVEMATGHDTAPEHPLSFDEKNWSVLIIKPDAMVAGLQPEIIDQLYESGLTVALASGEVQLDGDQVEQIWTPPYKYSTPQQPSEWWYATVEYMVESEVMAYLVHGEDASTKLGEVKRTIRNKYRKDPHQSVEQAIGERVRSLVHCSDRTEELIRNAELFWDNDDIRSAIRVQGCGE